MKKATFLVLLFWAFLFSYGQEGQLGIKGGLNISNITNNTSGNLNSRAGFNLGLLAHIHLNSEWALQPEVVYSNQGGKYTDNSGYVHQLVLNYINIPLQLQYMFLGGLRLQTGPQVGFLTNAKDQVGSLNTGYVSSADFKNVDFSWSFGLGFQSYSGLGFDARYNLGISNINNAGGDVLHNDVFQVGIFYLFSPSATTHRRAYTRHRHL